jgi:hypothetical protein
MLFNTVKCRLITWNNGENGGNAVIRRVIQQRFETRNFQADGRCAAAVLNTYVNSQDCKHVAWHLLEDNQLFEDSSLLGCLHSVLTAQKNWISSNNAVRTSDLIKQQLTAANDSGYITTLSIYEKRNNKSQTRPTALTETLKSCVLHQNSALAAIT